MKFHVMVLQSVVVYIFPQNLTVFLQKLLLGSFSSKHRRQETLYLDSSHSLPRSNVAYVDIPISMTLEKFPFISTAFIVQANTLW